jgi:hypothetical protein
MFIVLRWRVSRVGGWVKSSTSRKHPHHPTFLLSALFRWLAPPPAFEIYWCYAPCFLNSWCSVRRCPEGGIGRGIILRVSKKNFCSIIYGKVFKIFEKIADLCLNFSYFATPLVTPLLSLPWVPRYAPDCYPVNRLRTEVQLIPLEILDWWT